MTQKSTRKRQTVIEILSRERGYPDPVTMLEEAIETGGGTLRGAAKVLEIGHGTVINYLSRHGLKIEKSIRLVRNA